MILKNTKLEHVLKYFFFTSFFYRKKRNFMTKLVENEDFMKLVHDGNTQKVKEIIEGLKPSPDDLYCLYFPIMDTFYKSFDILKYLLEYGCDINAKVELGFSLLHIAIKKNAKKVFDFLIENGADIRAVTEKGDNIVHTAAFENNMYFLKYCIQILNLKDFVNSISKESITPLSLAAHKGSFQAVKYLYDQGALLEIPSDTGKTALHVACAKGFPEIVKFLIAKGANIETQSKNGATPLISAALNNHRYIVKILVNRGANIDACDNTKLTALHVAAYKPECLKIVEYLAKNHANLELESATGATPLIRAVYQGAIENAKVLINYGADPNHTDMYQRNCLHICAKIGNDSNLEFAQFLIDHNCNLEATDNYGNTPLFTAVYNGNLSFIELFLRNGANIKCYDSLGKTLLHTAVEKQDFEIVQYLVEKGIKVNKKDNSLKTPLFYAGNNEKIIKYLLEKGADPNHVDKDGNTYNTCND